MSSSFGFLQWPKNLTLALKAHRRPTSFSLVARNIFTSSSSSLLLFTSHPARYTPQRVNDNVPCGRLSSERFYSTSHGHPGGGADLEKVGFWQNERYNVGWGKNEHFSRPQQYYFVINSVSEAETNLMRGNATRLMELPLGQYALDNWIQAEDTLKWWISQDTEESVDISIHLLERFVKEAASSENAKKNFAEFFDNGVMTALVINWFDRWKHKDFSWTPVKFLKAIDYFHQTLTDVNSLRVTGPIVSYVIHALSIRSTPAVAAAHADELFHFYLDSPGVMRRLDLSRYLLNCVLNLWSKSGRSDSVARAEATFSKARRMKIGIDIIAFNTMLNVYSQAGRAENAETLLEVMLMDWLETPFYPRPDEISFITTASAWFRSGDPQAPERATKLLRRMTNPFDPLGKLEIVPTTAFFNNLLAAWARCGRPDAAEQAYEILNVMGDLGYEKVKSDIISFGIVAGAFAKAGNPEKTEMVIQELSKRYSDTKDESMRPTPRIFAILMDAWMRSDSREKEDKVLGVLELMKKLHQDGTLSHGPDTFSYNYVLSAIASSKEQHDRSKRADAFLENMKLMYKKGCANSRPNAWSYSSVIISYLETPSGVKRAEELLSEAHNAGFKLSLKSFGRVIHALVKADDFIAADVWLHRVLDSTEEGEYGEQTPSAKLLTAVVAGWYRAAKTGEANAEPRAEKLVRRWQELYDKGLVKEPIGNIIISNMQQIAEFTGQTEAADRSYRLITELRKAANDGHTDEVPERGTYAYVIRKYARDGRPESAELVLEEMIADYFKNGGRAKPDTIIFNNVLLSYIYSKSTNSAPEKVDAVFDAMQRLSVAPSRQTFHFAMDIFRKHKGTAAKTMSYFNQMKQRFLSGVEDCKPTGLSYKFVVEALIREGMHLEAEGYLRDACKAYRAGVTEQPPPPGHFEQVEEGLWMMTQQNQGGQTSDNVRAIRNMLVPGGNNHKNSAADLAQQIQGRIYGLRRLFRETMQSPSAVQSRGR